MVTAPLTALLSWMTLVFAEGEICPVPQRIGPEDSPVVVEAFLDPVDSNALRAFVELRRLASERPGELGVTLHWMSAPGFRDPEDHRARMWLVAMGDAGVLDPALAVLHRDGADRLAVRLHHRSSRAALAEEIGIDVVLHEATWNGRCAAAALGAARRAALEPLAAEAEPVLRSPRFIVGDSTFEDSPELETLRTLLARPVDAPSSAPVPEAGSPTPSYARSTSERLRRPELRGAILGGAGLPHRFVVTPRSEDDTVLTMLLPPVLAFRQRQPGRIAVHIAARGAGLHADRLRHRLCASVRRGLVVPYVQWLAQEPAQRPDMQKMLDVLDAVPARECPAEPDPADLGLPEGGWLDGIPRSRGDLETLEDTLDLLDATVRPLTSWVPPNADGL